MNVALRDARFAEGVHPVSSGPPPRRASRPLDSWAARGRLSLRPRERSTAGLRRVWTGPSRLLASGDQRARSSHQASTLLLRFRLSVAEGRGSRELHLERFFLAWFRVQQEHRYRTGQSTRNKNKIGGALLGAISGSFYSRPVQRSSVLEKCLLPYTADVIARHPLVLSRALLPCSDASAVCGASSFVLWLV